MKTKYELQSFLLSVNLATLAQIQLLLPGKVNPLNQKDLHKCELTVQQLIH